MPEPDTRPWLVVIDIQHVFTDPASGWYAEGADAAIAVIDRLMDRDVVLWGVATAAAVLAGPAR